MAKEIQDVESTMRSVMQVAEFTADTSKEAAELTGKTAAVAASTLTKAGSALIRYVRTREFSDPGANLLSSYERNGGQLRNISGNKPVMEEMKRRMDKAGIPNVPYIINQKDGEHNYGILYELKDEEKVLEQRERILAEKSKVLHVSKNTLTYLNKGEEPEKTCGITYDEILQLKDRLKDNRILFASEREDDGSYSVYYRQTDEQKVKVLEAGIRQEKQITGRNIYGQMAYDRQRRETAAKMVLASPERNFLIGNASCSMYLTKEGLYYEDNRSIGYREFVPRSSDQFEKKLCQNLDRINNPKIISDERAEQLGKEIRENILEKRTTIHMTLGQAAKKLGFDSLKDAQKNLDEVPKEIGKLQKDRESMEAYYKLQRSVELFKATQEGTRPYYGKDEKALYDLESQARRDFELCINHGTQEMRGMADDYMEGRLSVTEIQLFAQENRQYADDLRRTIEIRTDMDIPDYLDQDHDRILDDYDLDIQKESQEEINRDGSSETVKEKFYTVREEVRIEIDEYMQDPMFEMQQTDTQEYVRDDTRERRE